MRTWRSPMSATSQGAFVVIPEISHSDISDIIGERAVAAAGNHREPRQPFRYTKENIIRWSLELDVFLRIDIDTALQHFKVQMRRFQCFKESGGADTADNLTLLDRITDLHHFVG